MEKYTSFFSLFVWLVLSGGSVWLSEDDDCIA